MAKIIGFTCGSFDLTHCGHYLMFEECKKQCDYLIVGLQNDPSLDRPSKNRPIQSYEERRIQLASCKYIDKIIRYKTEADLYKLLKNSKISIRFIGADWEGKNYTGYDLPIKVIFNSRNHNFSSSNLRKRVYEAENKNR